MKKRAEIIITIFSVIFILIACEDITQQADSDDIKLVNHEPIVGNVTDATFVKMYKNPTAYNGFQIYLMGQVSENPLQENGKTYLKVFTDSNNYDGQALIYVNSTNHSYKEQD